MLGRHCGGSWSEQPASMASGAIPIFVAERGDSRDTDDELLTRLAGQSVIVTGGTRGIGLEIALALASAGANVVVTGRNEPDLAKVRQRAALNDEHGTYSWRSRRRSPRGRLRTRGVRCRRSLWERCCADQQRGRGDAACQRGLRDEPVTVLGRLAPMHGATSSIRMFPVSSTCRGSPFR